jgi:glutamine synthetase
MTLLLPVLAPRPGRWNTRAGMDEPPFAEDARTELVEFLAMNPATAWLDALCVGLDGEMRGKRYPRSDLEGLFRRGMAFPVSSWFLDATGACLDPLGRGISDGDPDAWCWPLPGTLAPVPWGRRAGAQVLMGTWRADDAAPGVEPRRVALREQARLEASGLSPCCAFELDFYLLEVGGEHPREAGEEPPGQVYRLRELEAAEEFLDDLHAACEAQGIPASAASSEHAAGQFEINLRHVTDAVRAADHAALFRRAVQSVARGHGLRATFMAKPFAGRAGSSMQLHVSLLDDAGRNVLATPGDGDRALSQAVAGLLSTLPEAMALYAPNVNSFRRFVPDAGVPVGATWGRDNRSVAVRIPGGEVASRRLEFRVPGADANPYLVLAAVLAAIRHGMEEGLQPGPEARGNACATPDPDLPLDWAAAVARLAGSALFADVLGERYLELYCEAKRLEARKFFDHISAREYQWYL